jgi:hypothetical protein
MKILAILGMFLLTSCQEDIASRSTIAKAKTVDVPVDDPVIEERKNVSPTNTGLHSRCQSNSRCLFARMPIYDQDAIGLENYIGNKIGISDYRDSGLCAPTAAAMVLRAALDERHEQTKLNNSFLTNIPQRSWYDTVYQIGVDSYTDFERGGTYSIDIFNSFYNYFIDTEAFKSLYLSMEYSAFSNDYFIDLIKKKKPAIYISLLALQKKEAYENGKKKIWFEYTGKAHAVVLKGFDGNRLHIQDPWGMDHFSRINTEHFARFSDVSPEVNSVFSNFLSGPDNFMGRYGSNHKIVLDETMALGLD